MDRCGSVDTTHRCTITRTCAFGRAHDARGDHAHAVVLEQQAPDRDREHEIKRLKYALTSVKFEKLVPGDRS
jgi:hypothetical protein